MKTIIWEAIKSSEGSYFSRARTPGGWLVREVWNARTLAFLTAS